MCKLVKGSIRKSVNFFQDDTLFDSKTKTVEEIAKILGIGRATCYRYIDYATAMEEQKASSAK